MQKTAPRRNGGGRQKSINAGSAVCTQNGNGGRQAGTNPERQVVVCCCSRQVTAGTHPDPPTSQQAAVCKNSNAETAVDPNVAAAVYSNETNGRTAGRYIFAHPETIYNLRQKRYMMAGKSKQAGTQAAPAV